MLVPIMALNARRIASSARRAAIDRWEAVQPFARAKYPLHTPTIGGANAFDPFLPPTIQTLAAAAQSDAAASGALDAISKLTASDFHDVQRYYMEWGHDRYAPYWRLANLITMVWAAGTLLHPQAYLEIGVQRGRSAAVMASVAPDCDIYGFDLWIEGYAGTDNPGPDFVRGELARVKHRGQLELVSGNSRVTLPAFLAARPDLFFDIVTIDGDKSIAGIASDFANALPRLKVGGVVIFDDIPVKPSLRRVWDAMVARDARYAAWEYQSGDHGVAAAVRIRA